MAVRAFEATYGYEYQGDNVLIARVNLLMTFEEYLDDMWHRKPTKDEYRKIINVIVWNIWQMDGLPGTVPYGTKYTYWYQLSIFDDYDDSWAPVGNFSSVNEDKRACKIFDWRGKYSLEYNSLSERSA